MPTASIAMQIQTARKRRAARDVEGPVQKAVLRYLRTTLPASWIIQHTANRPRSRVQGGKEKALGAIAGWPDLAIYGPGPDGPSCWFMEVKPKSGRVSEEQLNVHDQLLDIGLPVAVVRSVEDARKAVSDWRLPSNDSLIVRREA